MSFSHTLIRWYQANKRDLPFRGTRDPYLIWVSEVILQQTRMEQGLGYYERFVNRFPDLQTLGEAEEEEVLAVWQGLGYYSRARHMHYTARLLLTEKGQKFPDTYAEIRKLKGIGDYTAASIASQVFHEPVPAVDGNVYRFLSRYFGIREPVGSTDGKKQVFKRAAGLISPQQPGESNQALIEFGALVCKPVKPACTECVFRDSCYAFRQDLVTRLPVKKKEVQVKKRYFHYLVITRKKNGVDHILIHKRTRQDIWKNLYDFPLIETNRPFSVHQLMMCDPWKERFGDHPVRVKNVSRVYKHILSHQTIYAKFYQVTGSGLPHTPGVWIIPHRPGDYPFPKLISYYLQKEWQGKM